MPLVILSHHIMNYQEEIDFNYGMGEFGEFSKEIHKAFVSMPEIKYAAK